MSWELASFAVLAAVILAGFAWYERSRPPSQIVALVAALAALAVAGRIALAPIPNVVATTDGRGRGRPGRWRPGASAAPAAPLLGC